jgi:hypothetical protein
VAEEGRQALGETEFDHTERVPPVRFVSGLFKNSCVTLLAHKFNSDNGIGVTIDSIGPPF